MGNQLKTSVGVPRGRKRPELATLALGQEPGVDPGSNRNILMSQFRTYRGEVLPGGEHPVGVRMPELLRRAIAGP